MRIDFIEYEQSTTKMKAVGRLGNGQIVIMQYRGKNGVFDYGNPLSVKTESGKCITNYQIYINNKQV
jgi:hypothetical protein